MEETRKPLVRKVVSGGQTGVDRAGLDAAIELGIEHGGWCPLGRLAEDRFIPTRYALRQTDSPSYAFRTEQNVLDSDGTLIITRGQLSGGTELTWHLCRRHARPVLVIDLAKNIDFAAIIAWLREHEIGQLNIAGPRESTSPGIQSAAKEMLMAVLQQAAHEKAKSV